jgi:predicted Zn-dependent peptidase
MPEPHLFSLPNGLQIAVEEQPWNPGVTFQLLLPVGATTELEGQEGSTHLLEGWLWKGTQRRDARALADAFDRLGVQHSSGASLEYTVFSASFLPEHLQEVLGLYQELLGLPAFPEEGLEPLRQQALQELQALEDQPAEKMWKALRRKMFRSPHGRDSLGTSESLQRLTASSLREDFQRRFGLRGAILALAGGIRAEAVRQAAEATLGQLGGSPPPSPVPELSPPERLEIHQETAQVQIGLAYPDLPPEDPHYYASQLAVRVLSGGMGSRLFTEVREKRGLVYAVYAASGGVKGFNYLAVYAGTTPARAQETLEVVQEVLAGLQRGVSEEELERAKIGLRTALVLQEESSRVRSATMARDLFLLGRVRPLEEIEQAILAIDLNELNAFLAERPYPTPWIATLGPVNKEVSA